MRSTCYLIGYINKETRELEGIQLASESGDTITHNINKVHPITLFSMARHSYQEASDAMLDFLNSDYSHFDWLKDLTTDL